MFNEERTVEKMVLEEFCCEAFTKIFSNPEIAGIPYRHRMTDESKHAGATAVLPRRGMAEI